MGKVLIDGRYFDKYDAKVSVFDHGFLFGDAVTVGLRIVAGELPLLDPSLDRLYAAAARIALPIPHDRHELAGLIRDCVATNERAVGYAQVIVTRGAGMQAHDPRKCVPTVIVTADDVLPYPNAVIEHGLHVVVARRVRRVDPASDGAMSLHSLTMVVAKQEALSAGCLDAILLDGSGRVTGTIDAGLVLVTGGAIVTPPLEAGPDPVFLEALIAQIESGGRAVRRAEVGVEELLAADEVFLAGTVSGVVPIVRIDGRPVADGLPGALAREIRPPHLQ